MIFTILLTLWNSEQKNGLLIKLFCFSSDFDETWWSCSYPCVLQFHQVSSKSKEKQKSFINSPFFCSELQSVSRIVKIVHIMRIILWQQDYYLPFNSPIQQWSSFCEIIVIKSFLRKPNSSSSLRSKSKMARARFRFDLDMDIYISWSLAWLSAE